jgi:hypothetical protein
MSDQAAYIALGLTDAVLGNAIGNARSELADAIRRLLEERERDSGVLGWCRSLHMESTYRRSTLSRVHGRVCGVETLPRSDAPMKHPLKWQSGKGRLGEALGIPPADARQIEALVEHALKENHNLRQLIEAVGDLDISDELWANFLYTYGWWDGQRNA